MHATADTANEQATAGQAVDRERVLAELEDQLARVRGRDRLTGIGREYVRDRAAIDYVAGLLARSGSAKEGLNYVLEGYDRTIATHLANFGKESFYESKNSSLDITLGISLPEVVIEDDLRRALDRQGYRVPETQRAVEGTLEHAGALHAVSTAIEASYLIIRIALARGESADAAFDLGAIEFRNIQAEVLRAVSAIEAFKRERDLPVPRRRGRAEADRSEWLIRAVGAYRDVLNQP